MNEFLIFYIVTMVFVCAIVGLLMLYKYFVGNRLIAAANKLKSQMAKIRQDYPSIGAAPGQMVGEGIEGLGIDGIIDSLGLPKLVTPFVKGFLSNPDNINKILEILKQKGINIPLGEQKKEEIGLL